MTSNELNAARIENFMLKEVIADMRGKERVLGKPYPVPFCGVYVEGDLGYTMPGAYYDPDFYTPAVKGE